MQFLCLNADNMSQLFFMLFQAYTNELEQKVDFLMEENAKLKRQQQEVHD